MALAALLAAKLGKDDQDEIASSVSTTGAAAPSAAQPGAFACSDASTGAIASSAANSGPQGGIAVDALGLGEDGFVLTPGGADDDAFEDDQLPVHHLNGLGPAARIRRQFHWPAPEQIGPKCPLLDASEHARALPRPPPAAFNGKRLRTVREARVAGVVKIETPIDVDKFATLLAGHPNPGLVESVLRGLREGFWPCHSGEETPPLDKVTERRIYSLS